MAPAPAPAAMEGSGERNAGGTSAVIVSAKAGVGGGGGGAGSRPGDWKCVNPECDNVCFGFRVVCNRCGTGKDGTPPAPSLAVSGGEGRGAGRSGVGGEGSTLVQRPRLQLG